MLELHNTHFSLLNLFGDSFAYDCINLAVTESYLARGGGGGGGPGKLFSVDMKRCDVVCFMVGNFYPASNNINSLWQSSEIYEI